MVGLLSGPELGVASHVASVTAGTETGAFPLDDGLGLGDVSLHSVEAHRD